MYDAVDYDGAIRLLELDEVPQEFLEEFNSGKCTLDLYRSVISLEFSPQIQSLQHQ